MSYVVFFLFYTIAQFTFEYMCTAEEYVQSLLAVDSINDIIINNIAALERILCKRSCEVSLSICIRFIYVSYRRLFG